MNQNRNTPNQVSLLLRLLGGGYLVYTAWDLREAFQESPLYIVSAIVFAVVGLLLVGATLYQIVKTGDFFNKQEPSAEDSETEKFNDCEERL